MAEDWGKAEEKFDFTREGEAVGYIPLDQARLLAIETASETSGNYGGQYQDVPMVFEALEAIDAEDFYTITLSFRPQGDFSGTLGREQFLIEKEGTVAVRQVLSLPRQRGGFPLLPAVLGLVVVGVIAVVAAVFALGGSGDDGASVTVVILTEAPVPTDAPRPTIAPTTDTIILTPSPTVASSQTVQPTREQVHTSTPLLTETPAAATIKPDRPAPATSPGLSGTVVRIGNAIVFSDFLVELALTTDEQIQGLSGRLALETDTGMLFVYEMQRKHTFWMPDMHFPLDIVWIGSDCTVADVTLNALPPEPGQANQDLPLYSPESPAQYILEINAGEAEAKGIKAGVGVEFLDGLAGEYGC